MRFSLFAAALVATAATAVAQIPTGPFVGAFQEGFEGPSVIFTPCMPPPGVFGGQAQMCTPNNSGCHTTSGWGFFCTIFPHGGGKLFGSAGGFVEFTFTTTPSKFGGYFGTNSGTADANFDFVDVGGNVIGTALGAIPADCNWHWVGYVPPAGTVAIRVTGLNPFGGAFIDMDDLELDFTPPGPVNYCTAGTTTNGCNATLSATGNPDVAHSNTCVITANNVEGQKSGIIFYGLAQNAAPWCVTGGTSFLCVKAPTQRTPVQQSNGTANLCDGSLTLDWNAYQIANPAALGNPWSAGDTADVQAWFRDPPACKTTNLSDALELTYQP